MKNTAHQSFGWGMRPCVLSEITHFTPAVFDATEKQRIAFGNTRSYGDSALSRVMIDMKTNRFMLDFNELDGILRAQSGVFLSDIIASFVPLGWFPSVVPGTKHITLGGAIASDVHGKNHHIAGCFGEYVQNMRLLMPSGSIIESDRTLHNDLFHATCGGMGLTGIILDASIQLHRINSSTIEQSTIKANNLEELLAGFETYREWPYSVAWIDCFAKEASLGRSLLTIGKFANDGKLSYHPKHQRLTVPRQFPGWTLNAMSISMFNHLYYHRKNGKITEDQVTIDDFFFPLDGIGQWNRLYGKRGFLQYQCIIPRRSGFEGLTELLSAISRSKKGSFLGVIKAHREANDNLLSFPLEGYSLALDFKYTPDLETLFQQLDNIVLKHEGRLYLAKDARMSESLFKQGYPKWKDFCSIRQKYGLSEHLNSLQSNRLGI